MSEVYVGVDGHSCNASFTIPDDGDDVNAASVDPAFQQTADNWAHAKAAYPDLYTGGDYRAQGIAELILSNTLALYGSTLFAGPSFVVNGQTLSIGLAGLGNGQIQFGGTDPVPTASPGGANVMHGANVPKAWANVSTDGVNGVAMNDGYNVATITIGTYSATPALIVTMAQGMATGNTHYSVNVTNMDGAVINYSYSAVALSNSSFAIVGAIPAYSATGPSVVSSSLNWGAHVYTIAFQVFGRQT